MQPSRVRVLALALVFMLCQHTLEARESIVFANVASTDEELATVSTMHSCVGPRRASSEHSNAHTQYVTTQL